MVKSRFPGGSKLIVLIFYIRAPTIDVNRPVVCTSMSICLHVWLHLCVWQGRHRALLVMVFRNVIVHAGTCMTILVI